MVLLIDDGTTMMFMYITGGTGGTLVNGRLRYPLAKYFNSDNYRRHTRFDPHYWHFVFAEVKR